MSTDTNREWVAVPGHSAYEVTADGAFRSHKPWRGQPIPHAVHPWICPKGYPRVALDGVNLTVHSVILLTFVGPRPDGAVIRHLDGDHSNSTLSNLAYGTYAENNYDAVEHGAHWQTRKTHCKRGHAFDEDNTMPKKTPSGRLGRECRKCRSLHRERFVARRRAMRAAERAAA